MNNNENLVTEQVTENVEQTTEQIAEQAEPKIYGQTEFDAKVKERLDQILPGKIARREAKIRKEYEGKYGDLERVLKAGTGKESVEEVTDEFRGYYQRKGVDIPQKPAFTDRDIETLADAEAQEIINAGYEEVVEEVDRLSDLGLDKMTSRERAVFKTLAEYRQNTERKQALAEIGVPETVYNSQEFKSFAGQFNPSVPITDVYKLYEKTSKTSTVEAIGSMRNGSHDGEKTYYSPEDVDKLSPKDLDNPVIFQRVRESMKSW